MKTKKVKQEEILKKWEEQRQLVYNDVLPEDQERVLQEIDNIFNDIVDNLRFY